MPNPPLDDQPDLSLAHITKTNGLLESYIPKDLVDISKRVRTRGIICVQEPTATALEPLFTAAYSDGITLSICSGYRGPKIQEYLGTQLLALDGVRSFNEIAASYHSEHQLGTTVDITGPSVGYQCAGDNFSSSPEAEWLAQHAWEYGFNLSYPAMYKNYNSDAYVYEPWHWRYVGISIATQLHFAGMSYNELPESAASSAESSTSTILYY